MSEGCVPSSPHVLLVEDHDDTREVTVHLLKRHGYVVHAFSNAEDALRSAPVLKFDVALIDIALPEMDGVDLLHRLRAIRSTAPAVAFTACVMPSDLNRYYLANFDEVAAKPFDLDTLLATLRRLAPAPAPDHAVPGT